MITKNVLRTDGKLAESTRRLEVSEDEFASADEMLLEYLRGQREAILAIVDGLRESEWHRTLLPTGWTVAGMLEHLGGAEWHWFQGVVAGKQPELPGDVDEDQSPYDPSTVVFSSTEPSTEVIAF
jgi:hypothetical protein